MYIRNYIGKISKSYGGIFDLHIFRVGLGDNCSESIPIVNAEAFLQFYLIGIRIYPSSTTELSTCIIITSKVF